MATNSSPILQTPSQASYRFEGFIGERLKNNSENWLLSVLKANPGIVQMFRNRDKLPRWDLMPWSGEFIGKHLVSSVLCWRISKDQRLRREIEDIVSALLDIQDPNGYLGPFPATDRLIGRTTENVALDSLRNTPVWDLWGHYHCMLGLLFWFRESQDGQALACCLKAADHIYHFFSAGGKRPMDAGAEEMNLAIIHIFLLLYQATENNRYLEFARLIEEDWERPNSGDYVRTALARMDFFETPKPRWESLHDIQGIVELFYSTGDPKYKNAFEHIWWSILKGDRHNNGGFSAGEKATGNPYDQGVIETCGTVAWLAASIDMLRLSGLSTVADEIELTTFNAILGAQHPSGRWWTYNTPMNGNRRAAFHDIVFQAYQGMPELNCCSVNGPRGLGMIADWALMIRNDEPILNYYGASSLSCKLPSGNSLYLRQTTDYPRDGHIEVAILADRTEEFTLHLRVPQWSLRTRVMIKGQGEYSANHGSYLSIRRPWRTGDCIVIDLDMSLHFWVGERELANFISLYSGPILLAYDQRFNELAHNEVLFMDIGRMPTGSAASIGWTSWPLPWVLLKFPVTNHSDLVLCDFASAGTTGTPYWSWFSAGKDDTLPEVLKDRLIWNRKRIP
jgi:DUF1680 family protein